MSDFKSVFRIAVVFATTTLACTPATVVPDPPDLTATANLYDAPTGTLDATNISSFLSKATSELTLVDGADPSAFLAAITGAVATKLSSDDLPDSDESVSNSSVKVDAIVADDLTCLGWDADAGIDATENGTVHIQTVVKQNILSRVLWGTASHCRLTVPSANGDANTYVDGALSIYRYDSLQTDPAAARFLVRVDGTLGSSIAVQAAFDFRTSADLLEVRIPLDSGDVIALLANGKIGVRAKNGTFWCDSTSTTCTSADGTSTVSK